MRRALCLLGLAAFGAVAAVVPSAAAQTVEFDASVQAAFGIRESVSCPPGFMCGTAHIAGFGKATRTFAITGFVPDVPLGCVSITGIEQMTLQSDGSTLELAVSAALCNPGGSGQAPHSPRSQGDPFLATGTFQVIGGTGVFAGATGSGTLTGIGAGDAIVIHYTGTLTLAG